MGQQAPQRDLELANGGTLERRLSCLLGTALSTLWYHHRERPEEEFVRRRSCLRRCQPESSGRF